MSPHPTKRALVTGGSAGIGKETVRALAAQGYEVVVAARDAGKGEAVLAAIRAEHPGAQLSFHALDLSLPDAVVAFAQQVQARWDRIDALVLNAGLLRLRCARARRGTSSCSPPRTWGTSCSRTSCCRWSRPPRPGASW